MNIESFPAEILKCAALRFLDLSKNNLTTGEPELLTTAPLQPLVTLESLNLSYNLFPRIPSSIAYLTRLQTLKITNNPYESAVERSLAQGADHRVIQAHLLR